MADKFTTGSFTRDEWNNLLDLFITSATSALSAAAAPGRWRKGCKNRKETTGSWQRRSRRRWTWPSLARQVLRLCIVRLLIESKSPGILRAPCRRDWSSTGKLVATEEDQEHLNYPEESVSMWKLVASGNSGTEGNGKVWPQNLHVTTNYVLLMEKVSRPWGKDMVAVQRIEWKTSRWTQRYGVYLCLSLFKLQFISGKITQKIWHLPRITPWNLWDFQVTERLITDQTEGTGLTTVDWQQFMWRETTLLTDRAVQLCNCQNLRLFWLSAMSGRYQWRTSQSMGKQDQMVLGNTLCRRFGSDRRRTSGVRVDKFPRIHHIENSQRDSKDDDWITVWTRATQRKYHLHVTVHWHWLEENEETKKIVFRMLSELLSMLEDSRNDIGRCLDLVPRKNGTEHMSTNRMDSGIKLLKAWCSTLPKADIPHSVLRRKLWNRWIDSSHWYISVNQLCVYGAVAGLCKELARDSRAAGKPAASDNLESMVILTELPTANPISKTDAEAQWKLLREYEQKFEELPEQQKLAKLCSNAGIVNGINKYVTETSKEILVASYRPFWDGTGKLIYWP